MLLNRLTFHNPETIPELLELYGSLDHARLQAGGTFLLNSLKLLKRNGARTPDHIINLQKINALRGVTKTDTELRIKAMTTIDDLYLNADTCETFPIFKSLCRNISSQPIRNMATIGGNLTCRYTWTEMPAVAIGLNARLVFTYPDGREEVCSAESFFAQAAKTSAILTDIIFPIIPESRSVYRRVKKTPYMDIPQLSLLIQTTFRQDTLTDTRVAINNCVDFAQRDTALESFLNDKNKTEASLADEALDHMTASIYDKRAGDYKKHMFRISIQSALKELISS